MCIIAAFKRGKRPDKATIERMMAKNPDGVGIAWNTGKNAYFRKGFTSAKQAEKFIQTLTNTKGVLDIVFHARIATSGGVSAEKCHPFPMSADDKQLNRVTYAGGMPVVFHNGVFSIDIDDGLNDSQTFIKKMLYPLYKTDPNGLRKGKYDDIIEMAISGSRLVILYPDGLRGYGVGWAEEAEAWYSNSGYKAWQGYGAYYGYDADDWNDYDGYYDDYREWQESGSKMSYYFWKKQKERAAKEGAKV
jgi:hypothetical protein